MENTIQKITNYPVMEHFYTLQGEGFHTGKAAYFIRLGGCNVGCVWCDVKESWDAGIHPQISVKDLLKEVEKAKINRVVITGGEPAMYNLHPFCDYFHQHLMKLHLETSGAYLINGELDWITVSPKKFKAPLLETLAIANELKVVVFNKTDFDWAEQHAAKVDENCLLFLQPEWSKAETITPMIIEYIKQNPKWQLSLQTHKYIHIP